MPIRQPNQSRYLTAALGDREAKLTIIAVWLSFIALAGVLVLLIVVPNSLSNSKIIPANLASADFTDQNQIDPAVYKQYAADGKKVFNLKCQSCHATGGTAATGQGPRLDNSSNARNMSYVHTIVRNGVFGNVDRNGGMPFFKAEDDGVNVFISDQDLYKVVVYLRSIQSAPRGPVPAK